VAEQVLANTRAQSVIFNPSQDENTAALRDLSTELLRLPETNRVISGMMSGLDVQYAGLGSRMLDLDLITQDGSTRVSRLLHFGRGLLLSFDGAPRPIGHWAGRVDHVAATTDEDLGAVLIRPDGYIAWSDADEQPLEAALARWFG